MKRYLLDTNIYIRAARDGDWAGKVAAFLSSHLPSCYLHAVVAQELLAGAVDRRRERTVHEGLIRPFEKRRRVVTPRFGTWKRAGRIMGRLVEGGLMSAGGFIRSFVNDCLLGASCREEGLVLITTHRTDFELIRHVEDFEVMDPRQW